MPRKTTLVFCLLLFAISQPVAQAPTAAPAPVLVRAGLLIDPETGMAVRNQTVAIDNGKITAVGATVAAPAGASVIDLSQYSVLPGLFDAHAHLCMDVDARRDAGSYFYTTLQDPDSYRAIQGVVNARSMLEAGFTTVRDVGNEGNFACSSVRRAIEAGLVDGPTLLNAGRIIAPFGGQFHLQPTRRDLAEPEYFVADTRDEMRKAVRENVHFGARVIKIVVDDQRYIYSEDDIRFIVAEAAAAGLRVAAHAWTRAGAHNAAAAGVATIEHLNGAADEDLELAKRNGSIAVFTPFPLAALKEFRAPGEVDSEYATELDRLRAGRRVGIPIAFGTDAIAELPGLSRGATSVQWIDTYVAAGLTPPEILRAMTATAARALGVEKERGAIRAGMFADLIATTGNPLTDLQTLKQVRFVMKNGRIVKAPSSAPR
jgi:imidazolonepropionase-like amidohydrolase